MEGGMGVILAPRYSNEASKISTKSKDPTRMTYKASLERCTSQDIQIALGLHTEVPRGKRANTERRDGTIKFLQKSRDDRSLPDSAKDLKRSQAVPAGTN
jgi:hypothetical protein